VAIATTVLFFGAGALTTVFGDHNPDLPVEIWILPAAAALAVLVLRRDPRKRSPELSYTIYAAAGLPAFLTGLSFVDGVDPVLTATFVLGVLTLVLAYFWRGGRAATR
jgi:hypothetical protein